MELSDERINQTLGSKSNREKLGLDETSTQEDQELALKWAALASYLPNGLFSQFVCVFFFKQPRSDAESIEESFVRHVEYSLAQTRRNLTPYWSFKACALR